LPSITALFQPLRATVVSPLLEATSRHNDIAETSADSLAPRRFRAVTLELRVTQFFAA
jgi:hypothetical protein